MQRLLLLYGFTFAEKNVLFAQSDRCGGTDTRKKKKKKKTNRLIPVRKVLQPHLILSLVLSWVLGKTFSFICMFRSDFLSQPFMLALVWMEGIQLLGPNTRTVFPPIRYLRFS